MLRRSEEIPKPDKIRKYADWAVCIDIMGRKAPEGIRQRSTFRNSDTLEPGIRVMNRPHPRCPSIIRRPHAELIPTTDAQALDRRQQLDAQQKAFREPSSPQIPELQRPAAPCLSGEFELVQAAPRPGRTRPAVTSMSRLETWPAASFGKAIPAMAALSVQSAGAG